MSTRLRDLGDLATLMRWLGPWAGTKAPSRVDRTTRHIEGQGRAYLYAPRDRAPRGAYLIAPGLHYAGPDDPRLDRFCRVLAASGILVHAPFLPDFLRLTLAPTVTDHLALAFDDLEPLCRDHGLPRPAVFSISFGALPAIALSARPTHRDRVGALVVFGGFADFDATVRFAVSGVAHRRGERLVLARDPLNSPAVFINLLPHLDVAGDRDALGAAWRTMVLRTWGRMELKAPGARDAIAHDIARDLPPSQQAMFLTGCGLGDPMIDWVDRALSLAGDGYAFFDPRPHLPSVRAPVYVLHGRDDDVIPWFEAEKIEACLSPGHPRRVHVTGMASHTGVGMVRPGELLRELYTLLATVEAIGSAPKRG
jgi:pimeloyl-ACP methyl ester carboxylesterase